MSYELAFLTEALKEWKKLDKTISRQFKTKLKERLLEPRIESARLSSAKDRYKIKLKSVGYRLIYEVNDSLVIVTVVAIGKRERNAAYKAASKRI